MPAKNTASDLPLKEQAQFTERAFLGNLCEQSARAYCRRQGYKIVGANLRFKAGEIDLLARDRKGVMVVVEVRGRQAFRTSAWDVMTYRKKRRLFTLAGIISRMWKAPARVELVEVSGQPRMRHLPQAMLFQIARLNPERLGLKLRAWRITEDHW